jgi:DNA repair exonuclease SbcCD ATPase subunit
MNRFQSPLLIALTDRINLSVFILAIASGFCAAWWWALVGVLLWVVLVIMVARDPLLKMAKNLESRAPLAQRYESQFKQIERVQINIFNTITNAPPKMRSSLTPIQDATDALVRYVHNLCQRMTVLENHRLVTGSTDKFKTQITEIQNKLSAVIDPLEVREYKESLLALQVRLSDLENVERQLNRTDAQLTSLTNELNRLMTDIIRIQALDHAVIKDHVERVVQDIQNLLEQIKSFEIEVSQL